MTGSNTPHPARNATPRTGRHPDTDEQRDQRALDRTEELVLNPASTIYIEGRDTIEHWSGPVRKKFRELTTLAEFFNLTVCETFPEGRQKRRLITHQVDLGIAYAELLQSPGLTFERWLAAVFPEPSVSQPIIMANRRRAQAALSRLVRDGRVRKLFNEERQLVLWPLARLHGFTPPKIPETLAKLLINQPK